MQSCINNGGLREYRQFVCGKPAEEREGANIHPKVCQPVLYLQQWIRVTEQYAFKPAVANYQQSPHEPPLNLGQGKALERGRLTSA